MVERWGLTLPAVATSWRRSDESEQHPISIGAISRRHSDKPHPVKGSVCPRPQWGQAHLQFDRIGASANSIAGLAEATRLDL